MEKPVTRELRQKNFLKDFESCAALRCVLVTCSFHRRSQRSGRQPDAQLWSLRCCNYKAEECETGRENEKKRKIWVFNLIVLRTRHVLALFILCCCCLTKDVGKMWKHQKSNLIGCWSSKKKKKYLSRLLSLGTFPTRLTIHLLWVFRRLPLMARFIWWSWCFLNKRQTNLVT